MSRSYQFRIEQPDARQRLDEFLASRIGSLSRMRIANLIEAGACSVNGADGRAGYRIVAGDAIELAFNEGAPTSMFPEPIPLEVIYEDDHLIVVVKPTGMLVHPTMNVKSGTLANALAYHLNRSVIEAGRSADLRSSILDSLSVIRPGLVHRLDRATSGLIVVAKTPRALTILSRHFRKRLVDKLYVALVHGHLDENCGSINVPIGRDPNQQPRWRVMEDGKAAETRFKVVERLNGVTLIELQPVTGRTNQLRIHCAHIGHPIVGDEIYGDCKPRMSNLESNSEAHSEQFPIRNPRFETRLCLHASKLAFHHPANGEWMEFTSTIAEEFGATIERNR